MSNMPVIKLFLLLAALFALLISPLHSIQVIAGTKQEEHANVTQAAFAANATKGAIDAQLSTSERNRRLIPYMAFYLPAANLPINQQYAAQRPGKNGQQLAVATAAFTGSSAGLSPPLRGHIALPPAYMRIPTAAAAAGPPGGADASPQHHALYQPSAGDDYQAVVYGDGGGGNDAIAGIPSKPVGKQVPILHLLPPGGSAVQAAAPPAGVASPGTAHLMLKQKTVQHFPPIPSRKPTPLLTTYASTLEPQHRQHQHQQHQHQQQQQLQLQAHRQPQYIKEALQHNQLAQYQRQRPKQSSFNLTPFTSTNTLPGHFIPIIYESVSSNSNGDFGESHLGNNADVNSDENDDEVAHADDGGGGGNDGGKIQHNANLIAYNNNNNNNDHNNPTVTITVNIDEHQQKFIEPKGEGVSDGEDGSAIESADKTTNTPSATYHVINEASPTPVASTSSPSSSSSSSSHSLPPLSSSSLVIQHQQRPQPPYRQKHPHFQQPQFEDFFESNQQKYLNGANMTPQERYVLYLQQRINYNNQQQQQQQQHHQQQQQQLQLQEERERFKQQQQQHYRQEQYAHEQEQEQEQQQQQQHQYQQHMYFMSVTGRPVDAIRPIQLHMRPTQEQRHHQHHHPTAPPTQPSPSSASSSSSSSSPSTAQYHNYPQHSPVSHAVFARPELQVPPNHRPQVKPLPQIVHIPLHAIVNELNTIQQPQLTYTSKSLEPKYTNNISPSTPKYIDYIIEEPKQTLEDEEQQHQQHQQPHTSPPSKQAFDESKAPQAAYIVISTSAPRQPIETATREHELYYSTVRPVYKSSPTLHLHPVSPQDAHPSYPTRRPDISTTSKYILNSNSNTNPNKAAIQPITKLKPAVDHQLNNAKPSITPIPLDHSTTLSPKPANLNLHHDESRQEKLPPPIEAHTPSHLLPLNDQNQLPDIRTSSLAEILHKLQASNHLPQTLTPDNIDNSIKTLITILNNLKHTQTIVPDPSQYHESPSSSPPGDEDYTNDSGEGGEQNISHNFNLISSTKQNKPPGPTTGRPGVDYPIYADIPQTSFDCATQRYKGFFGDPETNCQVWHYCDLNGGKASFLCPNGTIFSQIALTCDWWFNVKCSTTAQLYVLNERLYKYILPFTPKFPEDYSGPLVDKYLAMKFQEMEDKMKTDKNKKPSNKANSVADEKPKVEVIKETTTVNSTLETGQHDTINSKVNEQSSERNLLIDDEVDDISQRGTFDNFDNSTQTTIRDGTELSLSLKPIVVVSSTIGPDSAENVDKNVEQRMQNGTSQNVQQQQQYDDRSNAVVVRSHPRETTKISVEKVEVIEIKTDGTSGHLTPDLLFQNAVQTK